MGADGLEVAHGAHRYPQAKLVYVTPSHQFPLGVTLSLRRRLDLLNWAKQNNAYVLEDDYDSEYRFAGRPLASRAATAIGIIEKMIEYVAKNAPLADALKADEVGATAAFLASPLASGITGSTVYVDKGYHAMGMAVERE